MPSKVGSGNIDPAADLKVEATWGFFGAKNAVMCGKGKTVPSTVDPNGGLDVYINDRVYWQNVPLDVWAMTIGGYPVVKKWLSYREFRVLCRPLLQEEMSYITEVVRRLKALLLMGESLDANYRAGGNRCDGVWQVAMRRAGGLPGLSYTKVSFSHRCCDESRTSLHKTEYIVPRPSQY